MGGDLRTCTIGSAKAGLVLSGWPPAKAEVSLGRREGSTNAENFTKQQGPLNRRFTKAEVPMEGLLLVNMSLK